MIQFFSGIVALCVPFFCQAHFASTSDVHVIEKALSHVDRNTLVIFDLEGVLYTPKDQILQPQHKTYLRKLESKMEERIGKKEAKILYSTILMQRKERPVDAKIVSLMAELQKKGIKVMGLTNCGSNTFGKIPALHDWMLERLQSLGYRLDLSWNLPETSFPEFLSKKVPPSHPVFKKGVLFTCGLSKGKLLETFLKKNSLKPSKIIFIDDKKSNLKDLEQMAVKRKISFEGIHFTLAQNLESHPLNTERATFQITTLEKKKTWLSNSECP